MAARHPHPDHYDAGARQPPGEHHRAGRLRGRAHRAADSDHRRGRPPGLDGGVCDRRRAQRCHPRPPALSEALDRLDAGEANALMAAKLDRVSRSVADFAGLLDRAQRKGWRLVLLDTGVDTSTASGELVSNMLASAAQYERRLISQRTRDGLAAKRAQGVRLGRPSVLPTEVVQRIVTERAEGSALRVIAEGLTADGVATARGKAMWSTSSVQAVLRGQDAAALM